MMSDDHTRLRPMDDNPTDPNAQAKEVYSVMAPCEIIITPTKKFKNGTCQWLVYGTFVNATSREKPSLGTVRAATIQEAKAMVQSILDENFKDFIEYRIPPQP